jgi:two-component system response regulator (stage 0 sporulation protein F)
MRNCPAIASERALARATSGARKPRPRGYDIDQLGQWGVFMVGRRRDVLVVDDDADIREVVESILACDGYAVRSAENGAQALELVRAQRPDLILLDIRMPVMDGREFHRRLGQLDPERRIRVALMSAYADLDEISGALAVDARLRKPFEMEELQATVARLAGGVA